ncbi:family 10 glycosylhydrolase [Flavobacterium sp. XN-5]|uniref:family 10 glycosylhydrolase n=1 Tax=Flavobacterium sp. XN-5 TaxID=2599390 RepID=UPI0011CCAF37|nr:family 10 glycosylhydrolase [Flavobacterium sp. XN-5]NGY37773.1 family 10 glycosylhydrolase [Flavobacterium sp. XN-5]
MQAKFLLVLLSILVVVGCNQKEEKKDASEATIDGSDFKFGTWITSSKDKTNEAYTAEFKRYKAAGIDEVLINTSTDPKELARLVPIAKEEGLKVHAWIMAVNRPGDSIALQHPEWYMVSREGKSCFDTRPYVGYYQWLCPTRTESRNHILGLVEGLAKVEGIESVHLDYIRFPDIFLPIGLLPTYNLKQETEMAEYDFCYCDACVSAFEKEHHKNPRDSKNTSIDMEWKQFRLNAIKALVADAYKIVHDNNKKLTAAVFPYPEMADHMVRQRWDKWDIDEVYPMIYHGFYNEEIDWIGFATKQGVEDVASKNIGVNTGIYIPPFKSAEELKQAIRYAKENGAKGVTFFDGPTLTDEYLKAIKETKESFKK